MLNIPKPGKKKKNKINFDVKRAEDLFLDKGIYKCEARVVDKCACWLTFAHRMKRRHYLGKGDLINDFNQIILICINCHMKLEQDSELTKTVFKRLRR